MTIPSNGPLTDNQLVELFTLDDPAELRAMAAGKGGMLFIDTCDGQWVAYDLPGSTWTFNRDPEDAGDDSDENA